MEVYITISLYKHYMFVYIGCDSERGSFLLDLNACGLSSCELSSCRAFPHARCEVDACDPCGTAHFISGVREVTDRCGKLLY